MAVDVHVVTPDRVVWTGEASMVVARGLDGEVGVLAGHSPLLVRLTNGPLRVEREGRWESFAVEGGFLHVTSSDGRTRVDVLATAVAGTGDEPAA
ncbi:MAG: ATP synthase F1 subunit epsilon [Actinomycetota bacterium]